MWIHFNASDQRQWYSYSRNAAIHQPLSSIGLYRTPRVNVREQEQVISPAMSAYAQPFMPFSPCSGNLGLFPLTWLTLVMSLLGQFNAKGTDMPHNLA